MIKEVDGDGKTIATYDKFSPEQLKEFEEEFGKDATNELLDHLNIYGEAQLISEDSLQEGYRRLFVEEKDE